LDRCRACADTDSPRALEPGTLQDSVRALADRLRAIRGLENVFADSIEPALQAAFCAPAYHPPAEAIVAGHDGTTWLRLAARGEGATWLVLDPAGAALAAVEAPSELVIRAADGERVWGVVPGPNGAPRVTRYRVGR
jgi:hypothetical protein